LLNNTVQTRPYSCSDIIQRNSNSGMQIKPRFYTALLVNNGSELFVFGGAPFRKRKPTSPSTPLSSSTLLLSDSSLPSSSSYLSSSSSSSNLQLKASHFTAEGPTIHSLNLTTRAFKRCDSRQYRNHNTTSSNNSSTMTPDGVDGSDRAGHGFIHRTRNNSLVVFGGFNGQEYLSDMWEIPLNNSNSNSTVMPWLPVQVSNPVAKSAFGYLYRETDDSIFMFGGTMSEYLNNDSIASARNIFSNIGSSRNEVLKFTFVEHKQQLHCADHCENALDNCCDHSSNDHGDEPFTSPYSCKHNNDIQYYTCSKGSWKRIGTIPTVCCSSSPASTTPLSITSVQWLDLALKTKAIIIAPHVCLIFNVETGTSQELKMVSEMLNIVNFACTQIVENNSKNTLIVHGGNMDMSEFPNYNMLCIDFYEQSAVRQQEKMLSMTRTRRRDDHERLGNKYFCDTTISFHL